MPAAHAVHADAPEAGLKFPGKQDKHAEELVLPEAELKVPGRHSSHADEAEEPWLGL